MSSLVAGTVSKLEHIFLNFDQWAAGNSLELENYGLLFVEVEKDTVLVSVLRFEVTFQFLRLAVGDLFAWRSYCEILGVYLLLVGDFTFADELEADLAETAYFSLARLAMHHSLILFVPQLSWALHKRELLWRNLEAKSEVGSKP